jgi:predicted acyl esterase
MTYNVPELYRLTVSSSNFPAYARNLNSGGEHHEASEPRPALQTVLHDAAHPSCLLLPVAQR